jgi:monoterpene epsilon-lactone hydrolase
MEQPPYAETVSAEARLALTPMLNAPPPPSDMPVEQMRAFVEQVQNVMAEARPEHAKISEKPGSMGGVPVRWVFKAGADPAKATRLLINFHGGGFLVDSGSRTETIPLAARTDAAIVTVFYRMAPEHPFPAAVDDALAVYREALRTWPANKIAIFGTSAGAVLTLQLLARIKAEGLTMPGAAGSFSTSADFSRTPDSESFTPPLFPGKDARTAMAGYIGATSPTDPLLSPLFSDLKGLPPTLFLTSTRDILLSHTVIAHRALRRAGVAAELVAFDGLPHAFWGWVTCPETDEAFDIMAEFFDRNLA